KPGERPLEAGPVDAATVTMLVERVNDFLRDVVRSVTAQGGDARAFNGFFDGVRPSLRGVFGRERLAPDVSLDAKKIGAVLQALPGIPAENLRLLKEGLRLMAEFAMWVASDQLPEPEAVRLADAARRLREGSI